jgi:hypothetical protein
MNRETPDTHVAMLETVATNAKEKVRQALARIVKWTPNNLDETIAKLEAIDALVTSFAGLDTLELTNIRLNLRARIQNGGRLS